MLRALSWTVILLAAGATGTAQPPAPPAAGWPQWGGPNRDFKAASTGLATAWPSSGPREVWSRPLGDGYSAIAESGGTLYTLYRPAKGMLGGMAALPGSEWTDAKLPRIISLGSVRHVFSHFALDLHLVPRAEPEGEGWWQPLDRLDEAGLPTLYKKAASLMTAGRDRLAA